jgi:hypothetical protein
MPGEAPRARLNVQGRGTPSGGLSRPAGFSSAIGVRAAVVSFIAFGCCWRRRCRWSRPSPGRWRADGDRAADPRHERRDIAPILGALIGPAWASTTPCSSSPGTAGACKSGLTPEEAVKATIPGPSCLVRGQHASRCRHPGPGRFLTASRSPPRSLSSSPCLRRPRCPRCSVSSASVLPAASAVAGARGSFQGHGAVGRERPTEAYRARHRRPRSCWCSRSRC